MLEKDFNSLFQKVINFHDAGFAYKIPDPPKQAINSSAKRPFDIMGSLKGKPLGIENKLIKSHFGAFNLSRLEDHQLPKLLEMYAAAGDDTYIGVGVCWWQSRTLYEFIYFPVTTMHWMTEKGYSSIPKKALLELRPDHAIPVKKGLFDVSLLESRPVRISKLSLLSDHLR